MLARLREGGAVTQRRDKWDIYDRDLHPFCAFLQCRLDELRSSISAMPVPARTLFLFWTMHVTMRRDLLDGADYTILDSFWYKHAASELIYGAPPKLVEELARPLPEPDMVFLLDVDPQVTWCRKQARDIDDLVPYECGMSSHLNAESFISHQRKLRDVLSSWAVQRDWHVLDGSLPADAVVEMIAQAVHKRTLAR